MLSRSLVFLLVLLVQHPLWAQSKIKQPTLTNDDVEVGFVEHLEDTIPLELEFYNSANEKVTLGEIIDKPTILSFVYFDCPGLCSPLLDGVQEAVEKVQMNLGEEYQVVTVSFNTKDTPEMAKQKKKNFAAHINDEQKSAWHYLTGSEENIYEITQAVGFNFKPTGFDFAHPSGIVIVSPEGKITRYLYGVTFLPFDVKMALIEASEGLARPSTNKVLKVCFSYDPQSQSYTLNITTIMGAIILFIAIVLFTVLLIKGRRKSIKTA